MRATAEVVAVVEPSRRRGALVGVLREEPGGGLLFLLPADARLPRCFVRPADLPPALKRELKARPYQGLDFRVSTVPQQVVRTKARAWEGFLLPADPRLPRCFARPGDLPPALKRELKARQLAWS